MRRHRTLETHQLQIRWKPSEHSRLLIRILTLKLVKWLLYRMMQRTDRMYRKLVYLVLVQRLLVKRTHQMFSHKYNVKTSSRMLQTSVVKKNRQISRKPQKKGMKLNSGNLSHVITLKTKTRQLLFQKVNQLSLNRSQKSQLSLNRSQKSQLSLNRSQKNQFSLNRNQKNLQCLLVNHSM